MRTRKLSINPDGKQRHFITGDEFILDNYRRNTFVYNIFECYLTGLHFITPPTIKKEFNGKMRVWFAKFSNINDISKDFFGFCSEINDTKDIIMRYYIGNDYSLFNKYDIKKTDELFMVFNPINNYRFLGIFQPQEMTTSDDYIYIQKFIKVSDEISFTPRHAVKREIKISEELKKN